MRWEQYYDRYNDFVLALEQTELVATVAASALKEFPHNLPADWRKKIAPALANLADALKSVSQEIESAKTSSPRTVAIEGSPGSELIVPIVNYVIATTRASPTDFQKLVLSQQLTMGFAYLSAFMGDSVRVVCCQRPNVLKCAKTFTWQQLTLQRTFNPYPGRHLGRSAGVTPLFLNFAIAALVWLQRALRLRFCQ